MKNQLLTLLRWLIVFLYNALRCGDTQCATEIKGLCVCEYCQKKFIKNTVWQKYCDTKCRCAAHELRTGEKLSLSKGK